MKILLLAALFALPAFSQSITGAISGVVVDPSNAIITGVQVRLTSSATGADIYPIRNSLF